MKGTGAVEEKGRVGEEGDEGQVFNKAWNEDG